MKMGASTMDNLENAQFRATAGTVQGFGATPREALDSLMTHLSGDAPTPIVIWPFNRSDTFFTETQQTRLQELKGRLATLTEAERNELEQLVEASFDATIARTQATQPAKS
jgi:hypothetical protein